MHVVPNTTVDVFIDVILTRWWRVYVHERVGVGDLQEGCWVCCVLQTDELGGVPGAQGGGGGLQRQVDAAMRFTRKWRPFSNVERVVVTICNETKLEPVGVACKLGGEELPRVNPGYAMSPW